MVPITLRLQSATLLSVLFAAALLAAACGPTGSPARTGPGQTYSVRGEIARLPEAGAAVPELWIRHEAIPDFTTEDGQKVGMDAMTMPFALAPGVAIEGFAPGDKVRFTLEVRWADRAAPARIARLEPLLAETELSFGAQGQ